MRTILSRNFRANAVVSQSRLLVFLAFTLLTSLLAAGCGSTASITTGTSGVADSGNGSEAQAPLPGTEEFGLTKEQLVENIEAVEVLIAQCMSEAGFEYVANDYNTVRLGMLADKSLPGLSESAFIEQYGYGISTLYTGDAPQSAGISVPAFLGLGQRNVAIFSNLSPADQVAYNRTLFGEHTDATFAVSIEAEDFSRTGGCTRKAIEQVFAPEQLLVTYLNPLDALIQQDPRMVNALAEFADCVRDAGFDYSHPEQIEREMKSRLDAITGGDPLESLSTDALNALAELQGEERAVAKIAYECEEEIVTPVEEQIQRELFARPVQ